MATHIALSSKAARSTSTVRAFCSPARNVSSAKCSSAIQASAARNWSRSFTIVLGIDQTIWLNRGLAGDDTHGHIDDITRFVAQATIVTAVEPDTNDPNHAPLAENLERLKAARTLDGKQFTLVELPLPRPVVFRGQRLPASYANFYIANDLVLVPTFHDPNDRVALNILAEVFPGREVIGIHSVDLVWGLGTLHCMTQQQPAALTLKP
jgi:agmatine deiminase